MPGKFWKNVHIKGGKSIAFRFKSSALLSPHNSDLYTRTLHNGKFRASDYVIETLAFFKTSLKAVAQSQNEQLRQTDANQRSAISQLFQR